MKRHTHTHTHLWMCNEGGCCGFFSMCARMFTAKPLIWSYHGGRGSQIGFDVYMLGLLSKKLLFFLPTWQLLKPSTLWEGNRPKASDMATLSVSGEAKKQEALCKARHDNSHMHAVKLVSILSHVYIWLKFHGDASFTVWVFRLNI